MALRRRRKPARTGVLGDADVSPLPRFAIEAGGSQRRGGPATAPEHGGAAGRPFRISRSGRGGCRILFSASKQAAQFAGLVQTSRQTPPEARGDRLALSGRVRIRPSADRSKPDPPGRRGGRPDVGQSGVAAFNAEPLKPRRLFPLKNLAAKCGTGL